MVTNPLTAPRLQEGRRVYVIGDVHGHRAKLERIHEWVRGDLLRRPVANPVLVHLGDLIDRGPDSAGVIALLANGPPLRGIPCINLMGNHEWMMLHAMKPANAPRAGNAEDIDRWLDNGGDKALASWGLKSTSKPRDWLASIPPRHLVLLRDLRINLTVGGYLFVHAGVRPGIPLAEQRKTDMLWIRDTFLRHDGVMLPETPDRIIVHGHTPGPEAVIKPNRLGLDTGAGKGGPLTCAVLEADTVDLFHTDRP